MAKFYGVVGYAKPIEESRGVWTDDITEHAYYGDIQQNIRRLESSESVNDNINVSNRISIVADQFAYDNFHLIKYVQFMGAKWKVSSVEVKRPRLILTVGGLYNGE